MSVSDVCFKFMPGMSSSAKVVEVSEDFIKELESGRGAVLKGSSTDEAVLCSATRTYALKRVEQSNSVFLFAQEKDASEWIIQSNCKNFFEIIPSEGKLDGLLARLEKETGSYSDIVSSLCSTTMASDFEIMRHLEQLGAIDVEGRLRVVQFDELVELGEEFLAKCLQADWTTTSIIEADVLSAFPVVPPAIVCRLLAHMADSGPEGGRWALNQEKVARMAAHVVFMHAKVLSFEDFHRDLLLRLPQDIVLPSDAQSLRPQLFGIALESSKVGSRSWAYCPAEKAPKQLSECIRMLFALRRELTIEELSPYVRRCLQAGASVVEALLPHTRIVDNLYKLKD